MNSATIIATLAVILMLFFAIRYIYKEKKKGVTCIGCPYAQTCQKHKAGSGCSDYSEADIDKMIEDLRRKKESRSE